MLMALGKGIAVRENVGLWALDLCDTCAMLLPSRVLE